MSKKKKNRFANGIILLCVLAGVIITLETLWGYRRLDIPLPGDVLKNLFLFWGGELLVLALRQIFGSDFIQKIKDKGSGDESI